MYELEMYQYEFLEIYIYEFKTLASRMILYKKSYK